MIVMMWYEVVVVAVALYLLLYNVYGRLTGLARIENEFLNSELMFLRHALSVEYGHATCNMLQYNMPILILLD